MTTSPALPESCGVAFKEWAGVCAALADGRQSLILRKGGVAEDAGEFVPEHRAFWLYPTHLHEAQQGLRIERPARAAQVPANRVAIAALALVETIVYADRPEPLAALEDLHIWTGETVQKRFHYRKPGLWVLGVRVFRKVEPYTIAVTPEHAGCKTWVPLEPPLATAGLVPVLDEAESARRMDWLATVLPPGD